LSSGLGVGSAAAVRSGEFTSLLGMLGVAVSRYLSAVDFQKGLLGLAAECVVTSPGPFEARTTSIALSHMVLLRATENLPRIAHIVLPSSPAFISFSLVAQPQMLWNGIAMRPGDLVIHAPGGQLYQRTGSASAWGMLSVDREFLARHGAALLQRSVLATCEGTILRVAAREGAEFAKLHTRAIEFVERRPGRAGFTEVAQPLEQDMLYALLCCFSNGHCEPPSASRSFQAGVMNRLAAILAAEPHRRLAVADLCAALDVSNRTLAACCRAVVGMGPASYMRLYRLSRAQAAIIDAERGTASIADLARQFGFSKPGRFAAAYRLAFGELPSATLSRPYPEYAGPPSAKRCSDSA
jgi:AraC-like DNA-binding protein